MGSSKTAIPQHHSVSGDRPCGFPCVGIPGTIDNDVAGTDYTIGYETALQTAVDAIDRLRDTSSSHQRITIVEIMGRHCSDLTISAGIAGGCEYIVASEVEFDREELILQIERSIIRGKRHAIIAITELITDVHSLAHEIESSYPLIIGISSQKL